MLNFDDYAVLAFDCYGTLIDWESGIWAALQPIFAAHGVRMGREQALIHFGVIEAEVEHGDYVNYKTVQWRVLEGFGLRLGFTPSEAELASFSTSVKDWQPFPDSPAALQALHKKYKLVVVSNVDDDLFAYSQQELGVTFDDVITAQQVQSYKPATSHFYEAFKRIGLPREKILHVAQSLFHDVATAKSLGLATVWVNRCHNQAGDGATPPTQATPDVEVPDLATLARITGADEL